MDIPRSKSDLPNRRMRAVVFTLLGSSALALVGIGIANLKPAAPSVERAGVWVDTVRRGSMLRQVRGLGTLLPEQIRWIPATTEGRVEKILLRPGAVVTPSTVLLELSNPELEQSALDARLQLRAAEAEYANLKVQLASGLLTQRSTIASVQSEYRQAQLQGEANAELAKQGLIPTLTVKLSKVKTEELANRYRLEQERLGNTTGAIATQLAVQQSKVDQMRELTKLRMSLVESLRVRAGTAGVLQQLPPEIGQRVTPGTNLARVADPRRLKAELKIAETQAKDIQLGQPASIDTHNGLVRGVVSRIDPAVQNGTVTVEVRLTGALPRGARPDLSVDGTIELERLTGVLYVGRPASGQDRSTISLFKLGPDGTEAVRVPVKLGRSSVSTVEILSGLAAGDRAILSDMSIQEGIDRIRLVP